jgi:hypothetical protein
MLHSVPDNMHIISRQWNLLLSAQRRI